MKKTKLIEVAVKMIVAALTAFLTALTTTKLHGLRPAALLTKPARNTIRAGFILLFSWNFQNK